MSPARRSSSTADASPVCDQLAAHDLAHGVARQGAHEVHGARALVGHEAVAAEPVNTVFADGVGITHDERCYNLTPFRRRSPHDSRLAHAAQLEEGVLDLARVDVVAACDDELLRPADDPDIAVSVAFGQVA